MKLDAHESQTWVQISLLNYIRQLIILIPAKLEWEL